MDLKSNSSCKTRNLSESSTTTTLLSKMLSHSYSCCQTATGSRPPRQAFKITAAMSSERNPRILCLHGFRTSGLILRSLITSKWPDTVLRNLDLDFLDGPFPATGKSDVERFYDPPYYEWYQASKVREFKGFDFLCLLEIKRVDYLYRCYCLFE